MNEAVIRSMCRALGLNFDEVQTAFQRSKDALPELANAFNRMEARQERLEQKVDEILARLKLAENPPFKIHDIKERPNA